MAKEKLLTEASCKAAKATAKMYYLNDGGGLRLRQRTYRLRLNSKMSGSSRAM